LKSRQITLSSKYFDFLTKEKYISLTTYYKSGRGVATPVEFVNKGIKLYINTRKDSYKVKRVKVNKKAKIAPCTMRGKLTGELKDVMIRLLSDDENSDAIRAFEEKYSGIFFKIINLLFFWRKKHKRVYLEITPPV
jgi:PPOX class probable F420-dependent enzyme